MPWSIFESPEARCVSCKLRESSHGVICLRGEGPPRAEIALVGQSPGAEEELAEQNFIGQAGRMLNDCIIQAGLSRDDLWICNAVRCRPWKPAMTPRGEIRKNRVPEQHEIDCCHGYLDDELKQVRPKVIVCLGKEAALSVLGFDGLHGGVLENQGRVQWSSVYNAWVITSVHPSYLLHKPGEQELLVFDLEKAARWRDNPLVPLPVDYRVI